MFGSHLKSLLEEKLWLFQLRYSPFHAEWMVVFLPLIWFISLFIWLPMMFIYFLEDKNIAIKSIAIILLSIIFGFIAYLYIFIGKPDQEKWKNYIFPNHIARIAIKVYDSTDNMIGGLVNRGIEGNKGMFYVENVPKEYWNVLKFREDVHLKFDNENTGVMGIFKNHRSFNGIDPFGIPNAVIHGRGGSSLAQQLVKNFYGQEYFKNQTSFRLLNTLLRKIQELNEAKTFYHNLRANDGEEFKRWVAMYSPSLVSNGSVYGIESVSAMLFGKKPKNLSEYEQILLTNMYKFTYYFKGKAHEEKCKKIKNASKIDIKNYYKGNKSKIKKLTQNIENWQCIDRPRVPFAFYEDMMKENTKGHLMIGNPNARIWEWSGSSSSILRLEIDEYRKKYPTHLVTEVKMTVDVPKNIIFKKRIDNALKKVETHLGSRLYVDLEGSENDSDRQANIWVSVVDGEGEIKYIYKRGNTSYKRRIGSISKIFEAIALGNRGDKWSYFYCNEPYKGLHNSNGNIGGECQDNSNNNIYSARKVFGASKNLPMMSAFHKYVIKNEQSIKIVKDEIENERLQDIYNGFNLQRDNNTSLKYELSFGLTNSTPFNLQKSIHKLTHLLYDNGFRYKEAHIIKLLKYKIIKESTLIKGGEMSSFYKNSIEKETRKMFDNGTKIYMQTVLKSALNSNYGTLKSFKNISNFETLFMKSGTTDKPVEGENLTQSKWAAGAIKVKGKLYSFVIMVENENGIGKKIGHYEMTKPIFNEIVKALNR